uniref:NADH-ubiquinone oxidoreductase chain 5 n=1 Tax=Nylanderia flavipes TaxID=67766 RepID=A0A6B9BL84_9HYME|nr:NADH dehydrogenase subunit 5 [Nylanderia flavipes]QGW36350.1 NADH dehydrogenase subunit 5 [Nylanderia flavipes]
MFINLYIYSFIMFKLFLIFLLMSFMMMYLNMSWMLEWMMFNFNSINVEIFILLDWMSVLFISVVMLISSMIMLYSMIYMEGEIFLSRFIKLVILFVLSMVLMVMSPNLISILFGWDGLGLISYCLVIFYQNYMSFNSGMVTVLCNRIGDIGLLMAIGLMFTYGSWSIYILNKKISLILFMIFLGGITKSAQIPFSVWLPMAMAAPTPVSALVHSSTLVTAGVYLMIRFNKIMIFSGVDKILFYISVLTMFMSGLMANFETDLKKIIALSTLSQLGLMMMILSLGLKLLAFYHLLTHAVFKSLLFMCAGIMIHLMNNNQDIRLSGKLNEFIPFTMISFYISSMALMGFPFLAGFYSKDLIMEMIYMMNLNLFMMWFIILSLSFTVSYSLRLFYYIYFGEIKSGFMYYKEDKLMNLSMLVLLMLSVMCGSLLNWMFFFDYNFTFMKFSMKMLTLIMLIFGIFIGLYFWVKDMMFIYFLSFFLSSMWYMNYMFHIIYKSLNNYGEEGFKMDKKWVEFYSKKVLLNTIEDMMIYKQGNSKGLKIYMFIFILIFMYMSMVLML